MVLRFDGFGPTPYAVRAMLDAVLRRNTESILAPAAARLATLGVRANALTLAAFAGSVAALLAIAHRDYRAGLGLLLLGRVFDGLDGPVARREGASASGAYLDATLDLLAGAAVPFAFALAQPDRALAAMFLMLGLLARASAAIGQARLGAGQLTMLIGKTELFAAFALACLFPNWFSIIAYAIGIACFIAAGARVAAAMAKPSP